MRVLALAVALGLAGGLLADSQAAGSRTITWADLAPLHSRLQANGVTGDSFGAFVEKTHTDSVRRVREGDLDHLVFYALQSTHFTNLPPIEPALSAKALVDSLDATSRDVFLNGRPGSEPTVQPPVRERVGALLRALDAPEGDSRLTYFRSLVQSTFPDRQKRDAGVLREYLRAMRFVYQKEFVAQRAGANAVAELYRTRGLSTDTAVEAGYVVYNGLGIIRALDPERRIRRVLIVGPGLDLAPRTGFLEAGPPESYQPWAVIDALLALGLSRADDLQVVGADINPRVVEHLARSRAMPPVLALVSEIGESDTIALSAEYRAYFAQLGGAIGTDTAAPAQNRPVSGHLRKTVHVGAKAASALTAAPLDIVTEHLDPAGFDLIIATNILPYFDDVQLMLAMGNISRMLAPGGVFLHNEARPVLGDITEALGLQFEQSRHVVIAAVRGAAPLSDSVWIHRRVRVK
jgi:SAM-dependent methyltransferase